MVVIAEYWNHEKGWAFYLSLVASCNVKRQVPYSDQIKYDWFIEFVYIARSHSFHANILTWFYDRTSSLDSSFLLSKINKKESCRLRMQMIKQQDVRKKNISSVKLFFFIFFFVRGLYVFAQFAFIRGVKMKVVETVKTKWHDAKATLKKEGLLLVKWMNNTKLVCQKPVKSSSESCSVSELSISANSRIDCWFRF